MLKIDFTLTPSKKALCLKIGDFNKINNDNTVVVFYYSFNRYASFISSNQHIYLPDIEFIHNILIFNKNKDYIFDKDKKFLGKKEWCKNIIKDEYHRIYYTEDINLWIKRFGGIYVVDDKTFYKYKSIYGNIYNKKLNKIFDKIKIVK